MSKNLVAGAAGSLCLLLGGLWFYRFQGAANPELPVGPAPSTQDSDSGAVPTVRGGQRSSVQPSDSAPSGPDPDSAASVPAIEIPAWKRLRLDELEQHRVELLAHAPGSGVENLTVLSAMGLAMTPILDELGAYEPVTEGLQTKMTPDATSHVYRSGMRIYRVSRGLFPAYDRVMDHWEAQQRSPPKRSKESLGANPDSGRLVLDASLLGEIEVLLDQGRQAILRRSTEY